MKEGKAETVGKKKKKKREKLPALSGSAGKIASLFFAPQSQETLMFRKEKGIPSPAEKPLSM